MMNVKTKFEIAYEPISSQTTRLTVEDYGELFRKIPVSKMHRFFDRITDDLGVWGDDERREKFTEVIKAVHHKMVLLENEKNDIPF